MGYIIIVAMAVLFFVVGLVGWAWVTYDKGATSVLWAIPITLFIFIPALAAGAYVADKVFNDML